MEDEIKKVGLGIYNTKIINQWFEQAKSVDGKLIIAVSLSISEDGNNNLFMHNEPTIKKEDLVKIFEHLITTLKT